MHGFFNGDLNIIFMTFFQCFFFVCVNVTDYNKSAFTD